MAYILVLLEREPCTSSSQAIAMLVVSHVWLCIYDANPLLRYVEAWLCTCNDHDNGVQHSYFRWRRWLEALANQWDASDYRRCLHAAHMQRSELRFHKPFWSPLPSRTVAARDVNTVRCSVHKLRSMMIMSFPIATHWWAFVGLIVRWGVFPSYLNGGYPPWFKKKKTPASYSNSTKWCVLYSCSFTLSYPLLHPHISFSSVRLLPVRALMHRSSWI